MHCSLKIIILLILNFFGLRLSAQSFTWMETVGGNEGDAVTQLASAENGIIAGGIFKNQINLGKKTFLSAGDFDFFITKIDSNGTVQRAFTFGNQGNNTLNGLLSDSRGNIYFSGSFSGTMKLGNFSLSSQNNTHFIAKSDSIGNILWACAFKSVGISDINDLQISEDEQFLWICGAYSDSLIYENNFVHAKKGINFFTGKIRSTNGKMQWIKDAPYAKKAKAVSLAVLPSGEAWICGTFVDSLQMPDRMYFHNFFHTEIFLARISADGNWINSKRFGGVYNDNPKKIRLSPDKKHLWMTGEFTAVLNIDTFRLMTARRYYDAFWAKMDLKGNALAVGQSNTLANCYINDLCFVDDKVLIGGYFQDSLQGLRNTHYTRGGFDIFWYRIDSSNAVLIHSNSFGGSENDQLNAFTNFRGKVLAAGTFQNSILFNRDTLLAKGFSDGWFACLKSEKATSDPPFKIPEWIDLRVLSNPTSETYTIIIDNNFENPEWELFSLDGKKILSGKGFSIPATSIKTGIYSLLVQTNRGIGIAKIQRK